MCKFQKVVAMKIRAVVKYQLSDILLVKVLNH